MLRFRLPELKHDLPVPANARQAEAGYLLASASVMLLIVIALIASFAFVMNRGNHFKGNYATGERMAELAVFAHSFAQQQHYGTSPVTSIENADLMTAMNLPDNFAFSSVANTKFFAEVRGADAAPLDIATPAGLKAASAYIHLGIRTTNGKGRLPSDDIALQAGASHRGMSRVGFYKVGIAASDTCNGGAITVVRWGPENSACLSDTQANNMFADLQKGDIIVPVWETALARLNANAMVRFPQPERADMSVMNTNLNMGGDFANNVAGYNINGAGDATSETLQATQLNMPLALKSDGNKSTFTVKPTKTITLNGNTVVGGNLNVYDQGGAPVPMKFNGPLVMTMGEMNVANTLTGGTGSGQLIVKSNNQVNVQKLGADDKDMMLQPIGSGTLTAGVRNVVDTIGRLEIRANDGKLAVAGTMNAGGATFVSGAAPLGMYAARMTTTGTAQIKNATNDLGWKVGSIEQKGNVSSLKLNSLTLNDCFSSGVPNACPNSITGPPQGGL